MYTHKIINSWKECHKTYYEYINVETVEEKEAMYE
jgi:hypothetical protein